MPLKIKQRKEKEFVLLSAVNPTMQCVTFYRCKNYHDVTQQMSVIQKSMIIVNENQRDVDV